jgi:hypothetical protein
MEQTRSSFTRKAGASSFSETEKKYIELIWSRVAEDFAPFDVDVTTELSCEGLITRSGSGDTSYGTRVLITPGIARRPVSL